MNSSVKHQSIDSLPKLKEIAKQLQFQAQIGQKERQEDLLECSAPKKKNDLILQDNKNAKDQENTEEKIKISTSSSPPSLSPLHNENDWNYFISLFQRYE